MSCNTLFVYELKKEIRERDMYMQTRLIPPPLCALLLTVPRWRFCCCSLFLPLFIGFLSGFLFLNIIYNSFTTICEEKVELLAFCLS